MLKTPNYNDLLIFYMATFHVDTFYAAAFHMKTFQMMTFHVAISIVLLIYLVILFRYY